MHFNDLSTFQGGGIKVVLKSLREEHTFSYKLRFPYLNNEIEYEALVVGLKATKRLGIKKLKVFGDYELVIKQIDGTYGVKSPSLASYKATTQELMKHFTSIECKVINWNENELAHSLATLATKSMLKKEKMTLGVEKQLGLIKGRFCLLEDWQEPLLKAMIQGRDIESSLPPNVKVFLKINWDLFLEEQKGC